MAILERTTGKEGKSIIKRNFLNTRSSRGNWYSSRRYEF
ncbi:hypothetical protein Gilli_0050 [Gillisia limnaea DSM 15749]|uniref:Uncharacterized protein n=1 Tax=Gillisia limnaea (strain DSM 15749 / LMG 21470 / R-8282) TaxID=865937 RepID=H2BQN9_GILLR|nr:hypothetical protein Gilli_0050 [Gillisia limnaea DSM 15749]